MADYYTEKFPLHWDPNVERLGVGVLLKKLNHVAIVVSDVNKSLAFYVDILGLQQVKRPNFFQHGAWLTMGNVELHLIKGIPIVPHVDHLIVPHISMESDDIQGVLKKLTELKVPFSTNVSVPDVSDVKPITQYFFRDPDGYYIELCDCDHLTKFCLGQDDRGIHYNELVQNVPLSLVFKLAHLALKDKDASGEKVVIPPQSQWVHAPHPVKLRNMLSRCGIYGDLMQNETVESISLALRQARNNVPLATRIIRENKHGKEVFIPPAIYKQTDQKYQPMKYEVSDTAEVGQCHELVIPEKADIVKHMNNVLGDDENRSSSFECIAKKTFEHFDKNKDGVLSKEELSKALVSLHVKLYETKFAENFTVADANHDSFINFEEFLQFIKETPATDDEQHWDAFFNMLDLDGNGKITCPELGMILREMNIDLRDRDLENLFIDMDEDGNGYVTTEEVRKFFKNN